MQRYMRRWHKRHAPEWNSSGEETEKTDGEEQAENMENETMEKMATSGELGETTESSGEEGIVDPDEHMAQMMFAVGKLNHL